MQVQVQVSVSVPASVGGGHFSARPSVALPQSAPKPAFTRAPPIQSPRTPATYLEVVNARSKKSSRHVVVRALIVQSSGWSSRKKYYRAGGRFVARW